MLETGGTKGDRDEDTGVPPQHPITHPLKSRSCTRWPRTSRNSVKAGLSSVVPKSSSSEVCGGAAVGAPPGTPLPPTPHTPLLPLSPPQPPTCPSFW